MAGQGEIRQLTSLRFLAAFVVLGSHLEFLMRSPVPGVAAFYDLYLRQGYCGVSFFYILSGFIIAYAYRDRLRSSEISAAAFLYRRATRILPLHWLVTAFFLAWLLFVKHEGPSLATVLLNLLLLHSWVPVSSVHYSLNGPSWSLSNEMFFYAVFPLLVKLPLPLLRRVTLYLGGTIALAAAAVSLTVSGYVPTVEWFFYANPTTRLLEFLIGLLLYEAYCTGWGRRWATTASEWAVIAAMPATMVVLVWFDVPMPLRYQLAFIPPMAAAILIFAYGEGFLSRMLRVPVLVLLGNASFALYLTHRPIVTFWERLATPPVLPLVLICIAVSVFVYRIFERPVQLRLRGAARRILPAARGTG